MRSSLPSGRAVMSLGDTAHSLDPIGGQGANNGNKMARNLVECVAERGEGPFDDGWMVATSDRFWARHGKIHAFNNALLEPMTTPGKMLLMAQYGSTARPGDDSPQQRLADAVVANFNDPALVTDAFFDGKRARVSPPYSPSTSCSAFSTRSRSRFASCRRRLVRAAMK